VPHDPPLVGAIGQTFHVPRTVLIDKAGRKVLDHKGQTDFRVVEQRIQGLLPAASAGGGADPAGATPSGAGAAPPALSSPAPSPSSPTSRGATSRGATSPGSTSRGLTSPGPTSPGPTSPAASSPAAAVSSRDKPSPKAGRRARARRSNKGVLTVANFILIRGFILRRGDRQTWCNMYNDNPHYAFDGFDAYLIPDVGQKNINCDPALSGFDEIVIKDGRTDQIYFRVKLSARRPALQIKRADRASVAGYFVQMKKEALKRR